MALPILIEPDVQPPAPAKSGRRPFRPPVGMPARKSRSRLETAISILIHAAIIWLALRAPDYTGLVEPIAQGAGGPGPAGGGGGRSSRETIQYITPQPAPPPQPKPQLVFKAPEIKPLPPPTVEPLKLEPITAPTAATGSSADGTAGAGPGTGGGVGSGVGTGTGTSVGPGTGGGNEANHPPSPAELYLPPLPVPSGIRGFKVIAEFDVDEKGRVLSMKFTGTGDRGYDRRLSEVLKGYRFRPGTRPDGTPIRMKAQVSIDLP